MQAKVLLLFLIALMVAVVGAGILAFSLGPIEKSEARISKSLTVKANEYAAQDFGPFPSRYDYVASFTVSSGTIKSCEPLTMFQYVDWQAGRYMPNLTETQFGRFDYISTIEYGGTTLTFARYFLFFNQDSYDKVIQISGVIYWDEIDTTNLTIGATLMAAGFFGLGIASARLVHSAKANRTTMRKRTIVLILLVPLTILQSAIFIFMCILIAQLYIQNMGQMTITDWDNEIYFSAGRFGGLSTPKSWFYFGFVSLIILLVSIILLARGFQAYRKRKQKTHASYTV